MTESSDTTSTADAALASVLGDDEESEVVSTADASSSSSAERPARSRAAMFSWHQVGLIVDFVREYDAADESSKRLLLDVVGWPNVDTADADLTSLAQALHPGGGVVGSFRFVASIASRIANGSLDFMAGVALASEISEFTEKSIRDVVRIANLIADGDLKVRRNTPAPEVLSGIVSLFSKKTGSIEVARIDTVGNLLGIWPGEA